MPNSYGTADGRFRFTAQRIEIRFVIDAFTDLQCTRISRQMTQSKQPYEHIMHKSLAHHLLYDARHNSFRFSKVLKKFDFFLVRTIETHEHLSD